MLFVAAEQVNEAASPVVHADEDSIPKDRPCDRMTLDVEVSFNVADELEWIFTGAIALG